MSRLMHVLLAAFAPLAARHRLVEDTPPPHKAPSAHAGPGMRLHALARTSHRLVAAPPPRGRLAA